MPHHDLELVSFNLCPYVQRAIIVLQEKNIEHKMTYIELSNKPDWFKSISPFGKVPLLKVDSEILFESAVISEFLDEITPGSLHPVDPVQRAKHRSWIEFGSSILSTIGQFYSALNEKEFEQNRIALISKFEWLEQNIIKGPYFAGELFHLVDTVYPTIFRYFDTFDEITNFAIFNKTPKVRVYRQVLNVRQSIAGAVKETYPDELMAFLIRKQSHLSTLIN